MQRRIKMSKTISAYYKALTAYYLDGEPHKINNNDKLIYEQYKYKLDALVPYFEEHLFEVWFKWFKYRNKPFGHKDHVDKPRLAVFCKFGIVDEMYYNIQNYRDADISRKELYLWHNTELFKAILQEEDDGYEYNFDEHAFYKGEKNLGNSYPNNTVQHQLTSKYYQLIKNEIEGN
jgi:hypothetical protein